MQIVKFKMPARKKKGPSPSKYLKNTEPSPRYSSAKKLLKFSSTSKLDLPYRGGGALI